MDQTLQSPDSDSARLRFSPVSRALRALGQFVNAADTVLKRRTVRPLVIAFIVLSVVSALLSAALWAVRPWYEPLINRSESLPGLVYWLDKTRPPECGDTTAFDMPVSSRFYKGFRLIKILKGCPGDRVELRGHEVFLNGRSVGVVQPFSQQGHHRLWPIEPGVIPPGKVYLYATHTRSYDSRYRSFGLRDRSELLGTATRIF